jgi:hypothetical protein
MPGTVQKMLSLKEKDFWSEEKDLINNSDFCLSAYLHLILIQWLFFRTCRLRGERQRNVLRTTIGLQSMSLFWGFTLLCPFTGKRFTACLGCPCSVDRSEKGKVQAFCCSSVPSDTIPPAALAPESPQVDVKRGQRPQPQSAMLHGSPIDPYSIYHHCNYRLKDLNQQSPPFLWKSPLTNPYVGFPFLFCVETLLKYVFFYLFLKPEIL